MSDTYTVSCACCRTQIAARTGPIDDYGSPCSVCGSADRVVQITCEEVLTLRVRESVRTTLKEHGVRRPVLDEKSGDDWSHSRVKWVQLERRIDRANDRYIERVTDPDTGEVIHSRDEPLSLHLGHGDARRRTTESPGGEA
ncbi:hypothetical protein tb265_50400 [Gemmatimonadetes bacterium T265]|nr:hypothetical protein tb265_50400 [Gemmatimonadetes bacterium T265]